MENPTKWTLVLCLICLFGNAHGQTADSTSTNPDLKRQSFYQQRAYPHQYVSPDARLKALENLDRIVAGQSARPDGAAPVWTQAEPQATIRGSKASSGVTTSMAADPRNANVVYLGTSNGGVWKTVDGGIHWMPLTDSQPSLSIGSIAVDPAQPEIIYAGTGSELGAWFSVGVLKSTDGGETWTNYPGPFVLDADPRCGEGTRIGSLAISPDNPQELLAGVSRCEDSGGIYRSTDGAVTWNRVFSGGAATALFSIRRRLNWLMRA